MREMNPSLATPLTIALPVASVLRAGIRTGAARLDLRVY